jgi:hypothetical protein
MAVVYLWRAIDAEGDVLDVAQIDAQAFEKLCRCPREARRG